ncbi:MAG TPA: hypothetical protein VFG68_08505 [Fimbriiglobus sp.]|nr:hypothetical protein [Fimbriiglobus sp.]
MTRRSFRPLLAAALFGLALTPAALPAAGPGSAAAFAKASYWDGFSEFWTGRVKRTDGVVILALGVGAASLFIITRAKWKK